MTKWDNVYVGETIEFTHDGIEYIAEICDDNTLREPWSECDGHGEVTEWTALPKSPGQLVLCEDHQYKRYYDFQGACEIARRDGWGYSPAPIKTHQSSGNHWYARFGDVTFDKPHGDGGVTGIGPDENSAVRDLYRQHRETMTPREYAARAARADYEYLRKWCNDEWSYVGVVVRRADACPCCGETESLWGVESNAGDYLREVAEELAEQLETEGTEQ